MKEIIHNAQTGEITEVDYSPEQIKEAEALEAARLQRISDEQNAVLAKKTILDKLGITEEEAKLLLGGN